MSNSLLTWLRDTQKLATSCQYVPLYASGFVMSAIEEVKAAVMEYHKEYRNPKMEVPIPSDLYFLVAPSEGSGTKRSAWPEQWPNAKKPGVYAFLDGSGELLYIGKADKLGARLSSYFRNAADKTCELKGTWGSRPPQSVFTVPVSRAFEASSLEEYLIAKLRPSLNKKGKLLFDPSEGLAC